VLGIDALGIVIVLETKSDFLLLGATPTALTLKRTCDFSNKLSISKVVFAVVALIKDPAPILYSTSKVIEGPFRPLDQLKIALLFDIIS
jgi:hypothetical protein